MALADAQAAADASRRIRSEEVERLSAPMQTASSSSSSSAAAPRRTRVTTPQTMTPVKVELPTLARASRPGPTTSTVSHETIRELWGLLHKAGPSSVWHSDLSGLDIAARESWRAATDRGSYFDHPRPRPDVPASQNSERWHAVAPRSQPADSARETRRARILTTP